MSREEKVKIFSREFKIKNQHLQPKVLLAHSDFFDSELRSLSQSPDHDAKMYLYNLTEAVKIGNKSMMFKNLV